MKVFCQHASVLDDDDRKPVTGSVDTELRGCDRRFTCVQDDVELTVRFEYGVFDLAYVGHTLASQLLRELVYGKAILVHLLLVDMPVMYQNARLSEKECADAYAFEADPGDEYLTAKQYDDRHKPVYHRYADILQRMRRQIRNERGDDKFRKLHLTELTLAEHTHDHKQGDVDNDRSRNNNSQASAPPGLFLPESAPIFPEEGNSIKTVIDTKTGANKKACDEICRLIGQKPDAVLALASGSSVSELYDMLAERCTAGEISLKKVRIFQIAEYEGDGSLRAFLERTLIMKAGVPPDNCVFLNADDLDTYDAKIADCGGLDLAVLGIGQNCHIGFNEPATPFDSLTHRQKLTDKTKRMKADDFGGFENVPDYGLTMGIKTITNAKNIMLLAFGESKAAPVFNMIYGKTMSYIPASYLQIPLNVTVYLDDAAASML